MNNSVFGKYQPSNTLIHRIDSRIKLVGLIILIVSVFLRYGKDNYYTNNEYMTLVILGLIFIILLIISIIGRVSLLQLFKQLKVIWLMVIFLSLFSFFFPNNINNSDIAFKIGSKNIYYYTIINLSYIIVRIILVMFASLIFTTTTKPTEITSAFEFLFYPLKLIKVPIHKFAMSLSLAIRFIPTLFENAQKIINAQSSRGVDYKRGKFKERIKAISTLIIPLFITSFSASASLADALEARGYDPNSKRTRYKSHLWNIYDTISLILLLIFLAGIILQTIYRIDIFDIFEIKLPKLK